MLQVALLLLVVANLGRIPFLNLGDREAPILINDLCIIAALAAGAVAAAQARSLRLDNVAIAALLFAAVGGLSAVAAIPRFGLTGFELVASLAYLMRWLVYFGVYVVIINTVRSRDVAPLWNALELAILALAAFGIIQAIFLPNFAQMVHPDSRAYLDWDPQGHRLMSTVLEPNIAAAMILTVLLVQVARLASGARVSLWKPGLLLLALVLTLSRSGALAFVVGGSLILFVRGPSKRMLRFAGAALVMLALALPKLLQFAEGYAKLGVGDASAAARLITWQRAIATFLDSPWFGVGFNTFGFVQEHRGFERVGGASYSSEGGLLFIAVMTGVVGLAVYAAMLWFVLRRCRFVWRHPRVTAEQRGLCVGTAAATIAVCVHSLFVNSLLTPFVMEPLWVLWGLAFVAARSLPHEHTESQTA